MWCASQQVHLTHLLQLGAAALLEWSVFGVGTESALVDIVQVLARGADEAHAVDGEVVRVGHRPEGGVAGGAREQTPGEQLT